MPALPENVVKLLEQPFLAHVCTTMPDGSPQVTPMWVDTDGEHILVNTVGRQDQDAQRAPGPACCRVGGGPREPDHGRGTGAGHCYGDHG